MSLAVDVISTAIERAKSVVLPFDLRKWFWIAVIVFFAGQTGMNLPDPSIAKNVPSLGDVVIPFAIVGGLVALVIGIIFLYLSSVFQFVFVDTVWSRKLGIRRSFNEYHELGMSFLWYRVVIGLIAILVAGGLGILAYVLYDVAIPLAFIIGGLVVLFLIAVALFDWVVRNLALPHMYFKQVKVRAAIKTALAQCRARLSEVALFWLVKLGLGIVVSMIMLPLVLVAFLAVGLVAVVFAGIGFALFSASSVLLVPLIAVGVILGVILLALLIVLLSLIAVPFAVFMQAYVLEFAHRLFKRT